MKIFGLVLFMTFNIICSDAQISQNPKMSPEAEMLPNAQILPANVNYKEFQRNLIQVNKIRTQEAYKYEVKHNGQADSILLWVSNFTYDKKNRIVEQQDFNPHQKLLSRENFYYNELNMLVKETINESKKPEPDLEINSVYFTYDSLGRIDYASYYNRDTSFLWTIKNVYNDSNYIIKHLQKMESSEKLLKNENQKLALEAYAGIFKVDKFHIADTLLYNSENQVIEIQHYGITHHVLFSYLINYIGVDPIEISVIKQTKQNKYVVGKIRLNKSNQLLSISISPEDTLVEGYDSENDKTEKFFYNLDGTLNTCIGYSGKKAKYIYKFVYKK